MFIRGALNYLVHLLSGILLGLLLVGIAPRPARGVRERVEPEPPPPPPPAGEEEALAEGERQPS